jgi:hypothetical protein
VRRDEILLRDAGQSALVGAGAGVGAFGLALLLAVFRGWPWWAPFLAGVVAGSVAFAVASLLLVLDSRSWLWRLEEAAGVDLTGDDVVGEPVGVEKNRGGVEGVPRFVYVRNVKAEQRRSRARDFRAFLRGAYDGKGTTWRAWKGERLPSGERVTRSTWEEYVGRLERAGLGAREYDTAPLQLTSGYTEALESFAEVL